MNKKEVKNILIALLLILVFFGIVSGGDDFIGNLLINREIKK